MARKSPVDMVNDVSHQFVWFELASDDLVVAKKFFQDMFGWKMSEMGGYVMVAAGAAKELGAGMKANPGIGHVPSHWAPYVSVDDVKAATKKAEKLGAKVIHEVHETPNGLVSTVLDPTGAPLNLWQKK
ncbi:MAG: VOC family protein [Nitrospirae bacterium]|nr:VOC family protein [Nitrospirota bacterium]